jgi:hypothetical protein
MNAEKTVAPQAVHEEGDQIVMCQVFTSGQYFWQPYGLAYLPKLADLLHDGEYDAQIICWSHFENRWVPLEVLVEAIGLDDVLINSKL